MVTTRQQRSQTQQNDIDKQLAPFYALIDATSLPIEAQPGVAGPSYSSQAPSNNAYTVPESSHELNSSSNNNDPALPTVPDAATLLELFRQTVPPGLYDNLHLHTARPPTAAQIELGNARNCLLLAYIEELAIESGIDITKFPALHDCVQTFYNAFSAMNWPPKEDIDKYGIGIYAPGNTSFSSSIGRHAGVDLSCVSHAVSSNLSSADFAMQLGTFDISCFAFLRNQSGNNPFLNLPDPIRSFMQAFYYMQIKEAVLQGNRTILQHGVEVRKSLVAGAAAHRNLQFREKLANLFYSTEIIDLPDIILTDHSLPCAAGPDSTIPYVYQFQLARFLGQGIANSSIILRGDSLANHEHSSLYSSLQQGTAFSLFLALTSSPTDSQTEAFRRTSMHARKEGGCGEYYKKVQKAAAQAARSEIKMSFADYHNENCLLGDYMRSHIMDLENRQYLLSAIKQLPICIVSDKHPNRMVIQRFLPKGFTFQHVLHHIQTAKSSVPQLLRLIWYKKSQATTARRESGEMSAEEVAQRAARAVVAKEARLADRQYERRICSYCWSHDSSQWYYCGGPEGDQTICNGCYQQERVAAITDICYQAQCGTPASHFNGGPNKDQPICHNCYLRRRVAAITRICYKPDCNNKATYSSGGPNQDQPICSNCYQKKRLAAITDICYQAQCDNRASSFNGGPNKDLPICQNCYTQRRVAARTRTCYKPECNNTAARSSGGPDKDQPVCTSCYQKQRTAAITDICYQAQCSKKAKNFDGGPNKDQPICGTCRERRRYAAITDTCSETQCDNQARYYTGGPGKDQPICAACDSRRRRRAKRAEKKN